MSATVDATGFRLVSTFLYDPRLPTYIAQQGGNHYPEPRESPCYLIKYQVDRMLDAANHFKWEKVAALLQRDWKDLLKKIESGIPSKDQSWRVSLHLDADGRHYLTPSHLEPPKSLSLFLPRSLNERPYHVDVRPWELVVDSESTTPSAFTTYKTTKRRHYDVAVDRAMIGHLLDSKVSDVLLVNPHGEVMEASRTTPYFQRRRTKAVSTEDGSLQTTDLIWVTPPLSSGGNASTTRRLALESGLCVEEVVRVDELADGEQCWLSNAVRGFVPAVVNLSWKLSGEKREIKEVSTV